MPHLEPSTFDFIADLRRNNNREWFEANRDRYEAARADFVSFLGVLIMELGGFDVSVEGLNPKHCVFRINRDTRFSENKAPYKGNFGARILPGGSKSLHLRTGYFMNIEPGRCLIGGGAFRPEKEWLNTIRTRIATDSTRIREILGNRTYKKYFGALQGEAVATAPRGFDKDHPDIDLIRHKSFLARHMLDDAAMFRPGFLKHAAGVFRALKPLKDYLDAQR